MVCIKLQTRFPTKEMQSKCNLQKHTKTQKCHGVAVSSNCIRW